MEIVDVKISDLKSSEYNPRALTKKEANDLKESLERFGMVEPIVVNRTKHRMNVIVGGHQRYYLLKQMGKETIPVVYVDIPDLKKEQELNLRLNKNVGHWEWDLLANFDEELLKLSGFETGELENVFQTGAVDRNSLVNDYVIPPFSVFDSRQGYWQERKRQWIDLGIKSEIGRDDNLLKMSERAKIKVYKSQNKTGSSIFDPVICEVIYKWFGFKGAKVLDPFAGGSVRGVIAEYLGLKYTGIDLSGEQIEANRVQAEQIKVKPSWIVGDSINVDKLTDGEYDLVFSCPPYFDLETYGDKPGELSNMESYDVFIKAYFAVVEKCVKMLKDNSFACFVVGDIRDKDGCYRNFVSDTISAFVRAGMKLYNEIILVNAVGSLPIRIGKQFGSYRKVGKCHQNILVFYKGDVKAIKDKFGNQIKEAE